jgi:hypothetical protein
MGTVSRAFATKTRKHETTPVHFSCFRAFLAMQRFRHVCCHVSAAKMNDQAGFDVFFPVGAIGIPENHGTH